MIPYQPFPVLLDLGFIKLYTYGLFVALGAILALYLAGRDAEKIGLRRKDINDLALWLLLGALIGARLLYVVQFGGNPIKVWEGGLVYWGGFIGGIAALGLYSWYRKIEFLKLTDLLIVYVPLAHAFGRVGCYFRGCCYGLPMQNVMPWAVDYLGALRHPTQIYSILGNLGVFAFLYRIRVLIRQQGMLTAIYLLLYPPVRFIIEIFRDEPNIIGSLSAGQVSSLIMFLVGVILGIYLLKIYKGPNRRK